MKKTIIQQLTILLVVIGVTALIAVSFFSYLYFSSQFEEEYKQAVAAQSEYAGAALMEPVFTYDEEQINKILKIMPKNEVISGVLVKDNQGIQLGDTAGNLALDNDNKSSRNIRVTRKDKHIGDITITFTSGSYQSRLNTLLLTLTILVFLLVGAIIFALIVTIRKTLVKQLEEVSNSIQDIAEGEGDLTRSLEGAKNRELQSLSSNFNLLLDDLSALILKIRTIGKNVHSYSDELNQLSQSINEVTHTQVNDAQMAATALNEMSVSANEVANLAENSLKQTDDSGESVNEGSERVVKSVETIQELEAQITTSAETIQKLKDNSDNIGSVVTVIKSIAEQTNLLALNAAIEAARAGEQGRGFAVVADEVRTLAQRTQSSTSEIESIVEELQKAADSAHLSMSNSTGAVEKASRDAQQISELLITVNDSIKKVAEMNSQVSIAAKEQSTVSAEVSQIVESINSGITQQAESVEYQTGLAQKLQQDANDMDALLGRFKLKA